MEHQAKKAKGPISEASDRSDLDTLLHPGHAFAHPMDVVRDPDLTLNEKRALLASWASEACAVEAAPDLRLNASGRAVPWDDIMDALRTLDREDVFGKPLPHYKRVLREKRGSRSNALSRPRNRGDHGPMLH
jgi:hypothetical protein